MRDGRDDENESGDGVQNIVTIVTHRHGVKD
jgi:hypothetical protein